MLSGGGNQRFVAICRMRMYDKSEQGRNLATSKGRSEKWVMNASETVDEQM
jgi:hypothetical protein